MILEMSDLQILPPVDENIFEKKLCFDLYKSEFGDKTQLYGSKGQKQYGVDIFVPDKGIGIQCKKRDYNNKIDKKILNEEVEEAKKFKPKLKRFILATTCKRDAEIQKEAWIISERHRNENWFSVEIHSWEEIKELIDKNPKVCDKYYGSLIKKPQFSITPDIISSIQKESHHQELNRIRDLMNKNKPEIAFGLLESFRKEKWENLEGKEKYRVLTSMGHTKIEMRDEKEGFNLLIEAYSYNKKDVNAHINCAFAFLLSKNDVAKAKEHIKKAKEIAPYNERIHEFSILLANAEGRKFDEIVQNLPENIKNQANIAFCLSQIAAKQNMKIKAKYWAKIAYDCTQKEDYSISSHYASMLLNLIPSKDYFLKKANELYQTDISTAINIYKKLTSEQEYSEINQYYLEWYNNLALALEYSGDTDESIKVMHTAIEKWPEDINLKLYLAELFTKTKRFDKSIEILKSVRSDSKFPISAKILLSENLFLNGNHDESFKILDEIIRSKNITDDYLEAIRIKTLRLLDLKKYREAEQSLLLFEENNPTDVVVFILKSKIKFEKGDLEEAKNLSIKAKKQITKNTHLPDKKILERLMYKMALYEHCESLLEDITDQNLDHPDIFGLLHVYFENGKNKQAIDLASVLLKKFPDNIEPVYTLFHIYRNLGNVDKSIQYYEEFLKLNPRNDSIRIELALTYIQNEHITKTKNLLQNKFTLGQLSAKQMNHLSFAYMQTGNTKKALETQYKCLKIYPNDLSSHSTYFELMTFFNRMDLSNTSNEKQNTHTNKFLNPKTICEDCFVQIQNVETSITLEFIIEKDAETYTPDHELSKALIGRKAGEEIIFLNNKYRIMEVKSKYVHQYQEIMKEAEQKFASKSFLKPISINKTGDIKKEISKNILKKFPHVFKQQENQEELFKYYSQKGVPIGVMAQILRKHPIDIIGQLIYSSKYKFISAVPQWENHANHLNNSNGILLDISSLMTIHQIGIEKNMEESEFKLYVCESTIDSLKNYIQELRLHSQRGLLTMALNKEGELRKHYISAQDVRENMNFWMKVKVWVEKSCEKKSISTDVVLSRKKRKEREELLGKEFFDSILTCDDSTVLLCEDAILRKYAEEEFSKSGVRLFDLVEYFEKHAIINNNQAVKFKARLVKLNQTYIPIDHKILMFLIKEAEYLIDDINFQRGLFFLSNVSELTGVISIVTNFLMEVYQDPSLLPHIRQVITRESLDKISIGRNENPKQIAYQVIQYVQIRTKLLPFLQNYICNDIMDWLRNKIY